MKKRYSRKQICEAIGFWKKQLRLAESLGGYHGDFDDLDFDDIEQYKREQGQRSAQFTPANVQAALVKRGFKKEDFRWVEPMVCDRIADMTGENFEILDFPEFDEFVDEIEDVLRKKLSRRSTTRLSESRKAFRRARICEAIRYWRNKLRALNESESQATARSLREEAYGMIIRGSRDQAEAKRLLDANIHVGPFGHHLGDVDVIETDGVEVRLILKKNRGDGGAERRGPVSGCMSATEVLDEFEQAGDLPVFAVIRRDDPVSVRLGLKDQKIQIAKADTGARSGIWLRPASR